jgi:predicted DNA-binding protein
MARNTLIGIRLEKEIVDRLDFYAKGSNQTRINLIRSAIDDFLESADSEYKEMAVNDYVKGIITAETFEKVTGVKPGSDLKELRIKNLKTLGYK